MAGGTQGAGKGRLGTRRGHPGTERGRPGRERRGRSGRTRRLPRGGRCAWPSPFAAGKQDLPLPRGPEPSRPRAPRRPSTPARPKPGPHPGHMTLPGQSERRFPRDWAGPKRTVAAGLSHRGGGPRPRRLARAARPDPAAEERPSPSPPRAARAHPPVTSAAPWGRVSLATRGPRQWRTAPAKGGHRRHRGGLHLPRPSPARARSPPPAHLLHPLTCSACSPAPQE